jgi:GSCFA family
MSLAGTLVDRLPDRLRRRVRDRIQDWRRRRPEPHRPMERYGLSATQVYPQGTNFDDCLGAGSARGLDGLVIRSDTPVASLGSCFADEFASHMRAAGFNYVNAESGSFPASANWGRVYTIPCFRQIVTYSTGGDVPLAVEQAPEGWFDPLRDAAIGEFGSLAAAEGAIRAHREASATAFARARVLIVTLGQNEAWTDLRSGLVWARRPPPALLQAEPGRFAPRVFSFEEDVAWLADALRRLRQGNDPLDVMLTVSPVASFATFCGGDAVTQSMAGKCVLRAVAERMTQTLPRVWYFPSFEMALAYNPHTLQADNRHVKYATVDRIFALLHRTVVR